VPARAIFRFRSLRGRRAEIEFHPKVRRHADMRLKEKALSRTVEVHQARLSKGTLLSGGPDSSWTREGQISRPAYRNPLCA
jgi:hypothetical protein